MNCDTLQELLKERTPQSITGREEAQVEKHCATCAACLQAYQSLQSVWNHVDALAKTISPERDLWPGIAAAIQQDQATTTFHSSWLRGRLAISLAAAICIIALYLPVTRLMQSSAQSDEAPGRAALYQAIEETELAAKDLHTELKALIAGESIALSDETLKVIDENLSILEGAVSEIELALKESPDDPGLLRMLVAMREKEMDLIGKATRHIAIDDDPTEQL